jgi:hypothetical protein
MAPASKRSQKSPDHFPGFLLSRLGHQFLGCLCEESRSRVAMSFRISVDLLQNIFGQSDVDANGFWLAVLGAPEIKPITSVQVPLMDRFLVQDLYLSGEVLRATRHVLVRFSS